MVLLCVRVGFAVVFIDNTSRGTLPEKVSIHTGEMTAIKTALKDIHKREDKRWVMYNDSHSSIYHSILNKKYDFLAELQAQDE